MSSKTELRRATDNDGIAGIGIADSPEGVAKSSAWFPGRVNRHGWENLHLLRRMLRHGSCRQRQSSSEDEPLTAYCPCPSEEERALSAANCRVNFFSKRTGRAIGRDGEERCGQDSTRRKAFGKGRANRSGKPGVRAFLRKIPLPQCLRAVSKGMGSRDPRVRVLPERHRRTGRCWFRSSPHPGWCTGKPLP